MPPDERPYGYATLDGDSRLVDSQEPRPTPIGNEALDAWLTDDTVDNEILMAD